MTDFAARRLAFRELHQHGCFVIPNPWDAGSARYLRHLGFKALATTSAGFAFSRGLPDADGAVTLDATLGNIADIVAAADVPVNADFESGYAREPDAVAANVRRCIDTGVAGLSIEDATGDRQRPLYDLQAATDRISAARVAIDASGTSVMLTARAECFLVGHAEPLKESLRRLQAYAEAGADVLYAPGVHQRDDISALVSALAPRPVNILMSRNTGLTVADLAALGVRRISVGSSLARAAWTGFMAAAQSIAANGDFAAFDGLRPFAEINDFFRNDLKESVVLVDASLAKLEEDTYAFWVGFSRRPGGTSGAARGAVWFRSGVPFVNYNGVVGAVDDMNAVDAVLGLVRAWNLPARWKVSSANGTNRCEATFAERGLTLADDEPGMLARIDDLPLPEPDVLTVDTVRDERAYSEWADVFRDAFGFPTDVAQLVRDAHAWPCLHDNGRTYLLMRRSGEAVATGLLHSACGVAGVYGIGVRRAFQKQGLGALATLLTVREGARLGAQLAVLQATKAGFPVYERLGFKTVCSFRSWRIA